jgi:hypothetical protein
VAKKALQFGGAVVVVLGRLVLILPGPSRRVEDLKNELRSVDGMVEGKQTNHRIFLWNYGTEIIIKEPWLGVGNGPWRGCALHEKLLTCEAKFYNKKEPYYLHEFRYDFTTFGFKLGRRGHHRLPAHGRHLPLGLDPKHRQHELRSGLRY